MTSSSASTCCDSHWPLWLWPQRNNSRWSSASRAPVYILGSETFSVPAAEALLNTATKVLKSIVCSEARRTSKPKVARIENMPHPNPAVVAHIPHGLRLSSSSSLDSCGNTKRPNSMRRAPPSLHQEKVLYRSRPSSSKLLRTWGWGGRDKAFHCSTSARETWEDYWLHLQGPSKVLRGCVVPNNNNIMIIYMFIQDEPFQYMRYCYQ